VFERYTERARRVVFFARYEASQFGSRIIETEHLLLGLIREDKNVTSRFLRNSSSIESIRKEIEGRVEIREKTSTSIDLPLSNECRNVLEHARMQADQLGHRHLGTEHLLLGLLLEEQSLAAEILVERGLRFDAIREEIAHSPVGSASSSPDPLAHVILTDSLTAMLVRHGFEISKGHLSKASAAKAQADWQTARAELQLFIESLVDAVKERPGGDEIDFPISSGFDWRALRGLRSGLSDDDDLKFRWGLTLLLAEVLLKRFEQRLNS